MMAVYFFELRLEQQYNFVGTMVKKSYQQFANQLMEFSNMTDYTWMNAVISYLEYLNLTNVNN